MIPEGSESLVSSPAQNKGEVLLAGERGVDKAPADLESLSHEATCLQTPSPAQLTPGLQQVQQEAEAWHTAGKCSWSLPRWFLLKRKSGLFSSL